MDQRRDAVATLRAVLASSSSQVGFVRSWSIKAIKVVLGNWIWVSGFGRAVIGCSGARTHAPATRAPQLRDPTGIAKPERRNEDWNRKAGTENGEERIKVDQSDQSNPSGFRGEALRGGAPGRRLGQNGTTGGAAGFGGAAEGSDGGNDETRMIPQLWGRDSDCSGVGVAVGAVG